MYGETSARTWMSRFFDGLSPHVRGNQAEDPGPRLAEGSIPACTGKPPPRALRGARQRVYPRMYGETGKSDRLRGEREGLSPHVRGNPGPDLVATQWARSIPACTGKPRPAPNSPTPRRVYPRMYGETTATGVRSWRVQGLSPHVRGNPADRDRYRDRPGSIPACTGKPRFENLTVGGLGVYPRMYGETRGRSGATAAGWGLSPHVRGNLPRSMERMAASRSIPACTGKPETIMSAPASPKVYPRMYGETDTD